MTDRPMLFDAGIWIASQDDEDRNYGPARELVLDAHLTTATLDLTLYEIANVVVRRWRDPVQATGLCRSAATRCWDHFATVDLDLVEATAEIALEHGLTSYDAAYVAAARRFDWQLVSTDIRDLVSKGLAITPDAAV
jgi:predicted nucleic acid-binding protein